MKSLELEGGGGMGGTMPALPAGPGIMRHAVFPCPCGVGGPWTAGSREHALHTAACELISETGR